MREEIQSHLHSLRLLTMRDHFEEIEKQQSWQPFDYLHALTSLEWEERHQKKIAGLIKQARLPHSKRLEDFDIKRFPDLTSGLIQRLCDGSFIDRLENLLIFGHPGTGKTHLSIALAREWQKSLLYICCWFGSNFAYCSQGFKA